MASKSSQLQKPFTKLFNSQYTPQWTAQLTKCLPFSKLNITRPTRFTTLHTSSTRSYTTTQILNQSKSRTIPFNSSFFTSQHQSTLQSQFKLPLKRFPLLHRSQRQVHAFTPNTKSAHVKPSSEAQLNEFLGKSDPRPLHRIDHATKEAMHQSDLSSKLIKQGSEGKFYLISRVIFAFESWTILFFGGVFAYYIYNVLQYRDDSPYDIAVRMWDNFVENSRQYRELATGKRDLREHREEMLRDHLLQHPNDQEAIQELATIEEKKIKRAKQDAIKEKQEKLAMDEFEQLSRDLGREQQKMDLEDMQIAFQKQMDQITKSGGQVTEQDLLDFIERHNKEKARLEGEISTTTPQHQARRGQFQ